jgi:choice-of-anchor A domain-containing protein
MVKFVRSAKFRILSVRIAAAAMLAVCTATFGAHSAGAAPITLGTASDYGLLLGTKETLTLSGGLSLSGNVGVGASDAVSISGSSAIGGTVYEDSGVTSSGSGSAAISGGVVTQSMTSIISAAASASTAAGALSANLSVSGGAISLNNSSMTIKALTNLSENVLTISALSLTNGTLTFDDNGHTGAKFIINVTGAFSVGNSAIIKGINGASGADIIFNIEGTNSSAVSLTGNSSTSIIGTILAPQRNVNIGGGGSLTGALIAGVNNAGKSYTTNQTSGGYNITGLGYTPRTVVNTPEPSSIAIFGAGMLALVGIRRRLRRP